MTAPSRKGGTKSAFLDTNALVRLFEFWNSCRVANIHLNAVDRWDELDAGLREKLPNATYLSSTDYDNVKSGIALFRNMFEATANYLFLTSEFCQAELHHTVLEALASIRLTEHKVPHDLRIKRPFFLYGKVVDDLDNKTLSDNLDLFFKDMRLQYDIDIMAVENPSVGLYVEYQDILKTAQEIWTRVLVTTMDAIILGTAINVESNVFVSSDAALRNVLSHINSTTKIRNALNEAIGRDSAKSMPVAISPLKSLP